MNRHAVPLILVSLWVAVMSVEGFAGDVSQLKEQIPHAGKVSKGHDADAMNEIAMEFFLQDLLVNALETPYVDGMGLAGAAFEEDFAAAKSAKTPRDWKMEKLVQTLDRRQKTLTAGIETAAPFKVRDVSKKAPPPSPADFMMVDIVFQEPYPGAPLLPGNQLKRQAKIGGGKLAEEFAAKVMELPALKSEIDFVEKAEHVARAVDAEDAMKASALSRGSAPNKTANDQFTNYSFALEDMFLFLSFFVILAGLLMCAKSVWNNMRYDSLDGHRRSKNGVSSRSCLMNPGECGPSHVKQLDYQFVV